MTSRHNKGTITPTDSRYDKGNLSSMGVGHNNGNLTSVGARHDDSNTFSMSSRQYHATVSLSDTILADSVTDVTLRLQNLLTEDLK